MTTITIDENIDLKKTHFASLEEFQMHLMLIRSENELSPTHKSILDERLEDAEKNTENLLTVDELKSSIHRA